ncbi:MAG: TonB-dependent receptor [Myxococcota bacterium]|nr:TonB-dependent receptor [Myxococcota bacterium]
MPRISAFLRLLLILVLLPTTALASVTKGTIKGSCIDEGGLPIPGVLVSISSENMMGARQMETDANGAFLFHELSPGQYSVTAEKAAFAKVTKPNLQVNIGRNTIVTIEMPLETAGEEIVVEESRPTIDTEQAARGSVLTKEFLERIPSGRSYQSAVQMAAGVTGGSNPNVGGAGYNENSYLLDGVNITDPVTGTFSLNFNYDAIEQIEVLTGAFDPEYGENLGGSINVVTESGTNTLEYNVTLYYNNGNWAPKLDARYAPDGSELAPTDFDSHYEAMQISAKIAGPIVRDRAWFVASYQHSRSLIANAGIDLPRDYDGHYILGKLTFQPSTAHRFVLLGQSDPSTIDNLDQSDRFVRPEAQYRQAQGGYVASAQWDWFISPDTFLETKSLVQKTYIEQYAVPCTHDQDLGYHPCDADELENNIDLVTPARLGQYNAFDSDNAGFFLFDDRWRATIGSKFSWLQVPFFGTHDFKAGIELDVLEWSQVYGNSGNVYFVDLNVLPYDPDTLENYYWIETTGAYYFVARAEHVGSFIQDVYKPIDNLTFRYGLRFDRSVFRNDLGEPIIDVGLWGPRFNAIWDPWADGKTKLVAGVGRFNDTGRLAVASYLSQSGSGYKLFLGEYFGNFTNEAAQDYYYVPPENTNQILDGTTAPHSDEFNLGMQRELIQDLALGLYFTGKYTRNIYAFDETNYIWDEDGYNIVGTSDGVVNSYYRLRTPEIARRDYYRTDVELARNWADRWEVKGTYSYTVSKGTVLTAPSSFLAVAPQVEYYIDGLLWTDVRHDVTAGWAWDIPNDPWTTRIGGTLMIESGNPETRTYSNAFYGGGSLLKDTYGTYARDEGWWELNLLVQQAIPVRKGKLWGMAEATNLTNARFGEGAYISSTNRWIISYRQEPVQFSLGGKYEF